jgi:hypothetical protein
LFLTLPILVALGVSQAGAASSNILQIVIENGPLAGTYKADPGAVICIHAAKQRMFSATFKNFSAHAPRDLGEAGIEVLNSDAAGEKHGNIRVAFGGEKGGTAYALNYASVTLVSARDRSTATFEGKTQDGIRIKITAVCTDVENF